MRQGHPWQWSPLAQLLQRSQSSGTLQAKLQDRCSRQTPPAVALQEQARWRGMRLKSSAGSALGLSSFKARLGVPQVGCCIGSVHCKVHEVPGPILIGHDSPLPDFVILNAASRSEACSLSFVRAEEQRSRTECAACNC